MWLGYLKNRRVGAGERVLSTRDRIKNKVKRPDRKQRHRRLTMQQRRALVAQRFGKRRDDFCHKHRWKTDRRVEGTKREEYRLGRHRGFQRHVRSLFYLRRRY